jgi:high-affinity iron transporter
MFAEILAGSTGSFLIAFRESLEAALIIGIIAAYLSRTGRGGLKKYLWGGTFAAAVASLGLAFFLAAFYGGLRGTGERLFEGTSAILATGVLTYMIFWMARNSGKIKKRLQTKVDLAVSRGHVAGIALVAFVAVFREGVETVLFLTALGTRDFASTVAGGAAGISLVVMMAFLVMKRVYSLNLEKVFKYSSILLIVFAAGLFGFGVHEYVEILEDSGTDLGFLSSTAYNINPQDSNNPFHEQGFVGSFFRGLVGWDGNPEWARVLAYVFYWVVTGGYFLKSWSGRIGGRP